MSSNKTKILVIDDNQDVRDLVVHILDSAGFKVFDADGGAKALEILKDNSIAVSYTHLTLPTTSRV